MIVYKSGWFSVLTTIIWIIVWTLLLNYLCIIGWKSLAWVLVLLPFIVVIMMILFFIEIFVFAQVNGNWSMITTPMPNYDYNYDYNIR